MDNCKILSLLLFLIFWGVKNSNAQTTIFSENCGSPSATTKVGIYTGWQNQGTLVFDSGQVAASADVRGTSISSNYTGASGGGNVFFSAASGSIGFSIEGINASTYTNLQLSYGYRKESASALPTFSVDYWDGSTWITVANTTAKLFNEPSSASTGWYLSKTINFPSGAQINGLKIRFVKSGTQSIRLDDIKLSGINSSASSISVSSTTLTAALASTYGTASSAQTVAVTGSGLTANIVATSNNPGIEISNDGYSFGSTATFVPISNSVNGTLYVRLAATAKVGNYNSQSISLISSNATPQTIVTTSVGNIVVKKNLTISGISIADKLMDGTTSATIVGTPSLVGVISGDAVNLYGSPVAQFTSSAVGTNIPVIVSGYSISGNDSVNYSLTQPIGLTASIFDTIKLDIQLSRFETNIFNTCSTIDSVAIWIKNNSPTIANNFSVNLMVNGSFFQIDSVKIGISPYDSIRFVFKNPLISQLNSLYSLICYSSFANDTFTPNDTISISFSKKGLTSGGDFLNFDQVPGLFSGGVNNTWALGAPTKPNINNAPSSPNILATNLSGNYNNNEDSWIQTGCYDLSGLTQPMVRFDLNFITENNYDGVILESSSDGGLTWNIIGSQGSGINWYNGSLNRSYYTGPLWMNNSYGWIRAQHPISGSTNLSQVIFRFHFYSDGSVQYDGVGIDNFEIFDSILYRPDVGIDSIFSPKKISCGQVFDSISIVLNNNSSTNSSNIPVRMILNGNTIANEIVNSNIPANGKLTYQFKTPIKHSIGLNNLQIIQLSADSFPQNDSLSISYQISNSDSFNLTLPDTLRSNSSPITLNPGNAQNFLWSTGETSPTIQVSISGRYTLLATNNAGCESFDTCMVILSNLAPPTSPTIAQLFNYQGIISGISGKPLINKSVNLRFSISDSSKINFQETKSVLTDSKGMFSTNVGSGNTLIGSLENISWWDGMQRKLMTEVDTNNSGTWINLGFSNIAAVPISLYSLTSGDGSRKIYGSFDVNGNIVTGNGFTITPIGNGQFEITFQKTFNEIPNVSVKLIGNGTYSDKILQVLKTKTIIQITGNPDRIQFEATGK